MNDEVEFEIVTGVWKDLSFVDSIHKSEDAPGS